MKKYFHISSIRLLSISTSIIASVMVTSLFIYSSNPIITSEKEPTSENLFASNYSIYALPIPETLFFANESVPINKSYVRESYDREVLINTYWQSQTLLLIKRTNRYFPVIEPILLEQGVPDDFKYLALIESGLMPRIVSPSGAAGIWQFMQGAAKDYGLEVNEEIDERYHLEKSTVAACRYLKKAHEKYGSWALAAASFNAGFAGLDRILEKQKTNNYFDLLLGEETGRYVFRILAIKNIIEEPQSYGFHLTPKDLYLPISYTNIVVNGPVPDFADFAKEHGISYRELKDMNPWLREISLTNAGGKTYTLKIPKSGAFDFE